MTDREILLRRVQISGLATGDAILYLDTHPNDAEALDYYKTNLEIRKSAAAEFERKYGPLTHSGPIEKRWSWVDGPWPWQNEEE